MTGTKLTVVDLMANFWIQVAELDDNVSKTAISLFFKALDVWEASGNPVEFPLNRDTYIDAIGITEKTYYQAVRELEGLDLISSRLEGRQKMITLKGKIWSK